MCEAIERIANNYRLNTPRVSANCLTASSVVYRVLFYRGTRGMDIGWVHPWTHGHAWGTRGMFRSLSLICYWERTVSSVKILFVAKLSQSLVSTTKYHPDCFDTIHACDRQTDRQTPHDSKYRAMHTRTSHGKIGIIGAALATPVTIGLVFVVYSCQVLVGKDYM